MASPRTNLLAPSMAHKNRLLAESPGAVVQGLLLIDQTGIEIINGHLFAGHIEGKTRRHFRNTPSTFRDDDKVDHDEDAKHDDSNHEITANKVAKGFDHSSSGVKDLIAMQ